MRPTWLRAAFLAFGLLMSGRIEAQDGIARRQCSGVGITMTGIATALAGTAFDATGARERRHRFARWFSFAAGAALTATGMVMALRADTGGLDEHARWVQQRCRARWLFGSSLTLGGLALAQTQRRAGLRALANFFLATLGAVTLLLAGAVVRGRAGPPP
ncbi:MAG: hypothetical protein AAGE52_08500 [Myxococcota bacterium]